jgi:hypothetical protein
MAKELKLEVKPANIRTTMIYKWSLQVNAGSAEVSAEATRLKLVNRAQPTVRLRSSKSQLTQVIKENESFRHEKATSPVDQQHHNHKGEAFSNSLLKHGAPDLTVTCHFGHNATTRGFGL